MKTYLKNRITSGKVGNIARQLTEQQCAEIEEYTNFLVDPKSFNERIFCYAMNITEQPRDIFGRPARFINIKKGYSYCVDQGIKILKGDINKLKKRHKQITKSITSNLNTVSPGLQEYRDRQKRIKVFSKRNSLVNKDLYSKESVENIDYRVCPVSKQRMSMIGANYIENTLKMTVEEYDRLYPGVRGSSLRRSQNIRKAIHTVDSVTGKTRYQISQEKSRKILSMSDENGVTGYKKKGQKTRATHMNNIDEHGRNGYSQLASKAIVKGNQTKVSRGIILDSSDRPEFYRYKTLVMYLTEKHRKVVTRGYKTGLAGTPGAYQLDHCYSILDGYRNHVSPLIIGNIENMKMIPWEENLSKHGASSILLTDLLTKTDYTLTRSQIEYKFFMDLIHDDLNNKRPATGAVLMEKYYDSTLCK